jgi:hypothetical protein
MYYEHKYFVTIQRSVEIGLLVALIHRNLDPNRKLFTII